MGQRPLMHVLTVGGNAVSAFLSWRLSATNACDVTLVWKAGYENVAQYGITFKYVLFKVIQIICKLYTNICIDRVAKLSVKNDLCPDQVCHNEATILNSVTDIKSSGPNARRSRSNISSPL